MKRTSICKFLLAILESILFILLVPVSIGVAQERIPSSELYQILPSDGQPEDWFGQSVALEGDTLAVASPGDDDNGKDSGSVYVFIRRGEVWTQEAKITPGDGQAGDHFGVSIALENDVLVVGANEDDDVGTDAGAAYVFAREGNEWVQQAKLTAGNGRFGNTVDIDAGTIAVAAQAEESWRGAVYLFVRVGGQWQEQARLIAPDRQHHDSFGHMSLSGDTIAIAAIQEDSLSIEAGAAYVFVRDHGMWSFQQKLLPTGGRPGWYFGHPALDGNRLIVGASHYNDLGLHSGSAFAFTLYGDTWSQEQRILASDGGPYHFFGHDLDMEGNVAIIGARKDNESGAAYIFKWEGDEWIEQERLVPPNGGVGDWFGWRVSLSGSNAAIGAYRADIGGDDVGAVYVYSLNERPTVHAGLAQTVEEGSAVTLAASGRDPEGDPLSYAWDLDHDGTYETPGQTVTFSAAQLDGPNSYTVAVKVTDSAGLTAEDSTTVEVLNVPPTVGPITGPVDPVLLGTPINASADFSDPGMLDSHTAAWDWGDGTTSSGTVTEVDGAGSVTDTHTYTAVGVYVVKLTVTDKDGASSESTYQFVVYDPDGGFVTGGGWIYSEPGACRLDLVCATTAEGKANFGFASKYKKGSIVPTGSTEFNFNAVDLNFHSDAYDWLVIGGNYAEYKGAGTINGAFAPNDTPYKLQIWAGDETSDSGEDTFRVRIWYEENSAEIVVYDNGIDQAIGGGNVQVHE